MNKLYCKNYFAIAISIHTADKNSKDLFLTNDSVNTVFGFQYKSVILYNWNSILMCNNKKKAIYGVAVEYSVYIDLKGWK